MSYRSGRFFQLGKNKLPAKSRGQAIALDRFKVYENQSVFVYVVERFCLSVRKTCRKAGRGCPQLTLTRGGNVSMLDERYGHGIGVEAWADSQGAANNNL